MTFRKPVATIEKLYMAFNRLRPPFVNQLVVEGVGTVDPVKLRAAIARSTEVNPGARLRLSGHLARMAWVLGPAPRLTVVRSAGWDGRSGQAAPFLDRPLDAERGPTCEIQLIEAYQRSFLVFRSLHAVMDGMGTLSWAQDVLRALRGEAPLGHPSTMIDTDFAAGLNDEPLALPRTDALHPCGRADAASSGNDFEWRRVTIAEPTTAPLVATLAVALAAEARQQGDGAVRFNIPADLRFFHKQERSTGNVIGTLFVDVPDHFTVEDVSEDLRTRLRAREHARVPAGYQKLRWLPRPALDALVRRNFAKEHARARYWMTATISFLGAVDAASVSAPGFAACTVFWIPPMADQSCFVACSRVGSHLELLLAMPRVLGTRGRFDALLERLTGAVGRAEASASPALAQGWIPVDGRAQRGHDVVDEGQRA
jgi:hypothetical protein